MGLAGTTVLASQPHMDFTMILPLRLTARHWSETKAALIRSPHGS